MISYYYFYFYCYHHHHISVVIFVIINIIIIDIIITVVIAVVAVFVISSSSNSSYSVIIITSVLLRSPLSISLLCNLKKLLLDLHTEYLKLAIDCPPGLQLIGLSFDSRCSCAHSIIRYWPKPLQKQTQSRGDRPL